MNISLKIYRKVFIVITLSMTPVVVFSQPYVPVNVASFPGEKKVSQVQMVLLPGANLLTGGISVEGGDKNTQPVCFTRFDTTGAVINTIFTGGPGYTYLPCLSTGPEGNVMGVLMYRDTLVFGGSIFTNPVRNGAVYFRMDPDGEPVPVRSLFSGFKGSITSSCIDSSGRFWIGGWYRYMTFRNTRYRSVGTSDAFLMCISPDDSLGLIRFNGRGEEEVNAMVVNNGHMLAGGSFTHSIIAGDTSLSVPGGRMIFVASVVPDNQHIDLKGLITAKDITLHDMQLLENGSLYLSGGFRGNLFSKDTVIDAKGGMDGFLLKTNPECKVIKIASFGGDKDDWIGHLANDGNGRLFAVSGFKGSVIIGEDTLSTVDRLADAYVAEIDTSTLTLCWGRQIGGAGEQEVRAVVHDGGYNLFITGYSPEKYTVADYVYPGSESNSFFITFTDPCKWFRYDIPDTQYLCEGASLMLDAGEYSSYHWIPGDQISRYLVIADTGTYHITVTSDIGCRAVDSVRVRPDTIRLAFETTDEMIPPGENGSVNMYISGGFPPYTIIWENGAADQYLSDLKSGTYVVEVMDLLGCRESGEVFVGQQVTSGIYDLNLYPNPFNEITRILFKLPEDLEVDISIYDISGRKVYTLVSEKRIKGTYAFEWHRKALKDGVYYLQIKSKLGKISRKMIITHDTR